MAVNHYSYDPNTPHGKELDDALTWLEDGRDKLARVIATLIQMKDGGTLGEYACLKYGFPTPTVANAALAELEAGNSPLTTAAATLNQMFSRFRTG